MDARISEVILDIDRFIRPHFFPSWPQELHEYLNEGFTEDTCHVCPEDFSCKLSFNRPGFDTDLLKRTHIIMSLANGTSFSCRVVGIHNNPGHIIVSHAFAVECGIMPGAKALIEEIET